MKIKFWKYTYQDARIVILFLEGIGFDDASIIGGIKRKGHSNNDIDIYLAHTESTEENREKIRQKFQVGNNFIITDWESLYLPKTLFGTLDIFFKGQTDKFDY